jgi:hypothetical protein
MAHWAELDENNIVLRVTVGDNNDPNGDEGYQWLLDNLGGRWIKTSYNTALNQHSLNGTPLRGNYAGVGMVYLEEHDIFVQPKPYPSWVLNLETAHWEPPVPYPIPEDGVWRAVYIWDEDSVNWIEDVNASI